MPYIGQQPAPKVVTSSDLADDVVTADKIGDTAISGFSALGATPADTDELLVSDAGTLKRVDFSHLKGGGMFEFISQTTVSSAVNEVEFTSLSSDFVDFLISASGIRTGTDNQNIRLRFSVSGTFDTASNYGWVESGRDGTTTVAGSSNPENYIKLSNKIGNATGENGTFEHIVYNPLGTSLYKVSSGRSSVFEDNGYAAIGIHSGVYSSTNAVDGFRIYAGSGTITAGKFALYGRKRS